MVNDQVVEWQYTKKYGRLVAKAWADPAFKERLLAEPAVVLREQGFDIPATCEVRVAEDVEATQVGMWFPSDTVLCVGLPAHPALASSFEPLTVGPDRVFAQCGCGCGSSSGPHNCFFPLCECFPPPFCDCGCD